ncbi:Methyl-accepting chemotaxis protein CtpH [compost metagenome]
MDIGILVMLLSSLGIGLFSLWLLNRNLIAPISALIEHIARLSQGRGFAAVADEVHTLAH